MPRAKSKSKEQIISDAMLVFWHYGFSATSMDDLVKKIGTSRHAIYSECGGKDALFHEALAVYQRAVVDPAFLQVEMPGADVQTIANYFEQQISLAEQAGPPFPGCLVSNTMTETGPHNPKTLEAVNAHSSRLERGFYNALQNSVSERSPVTDKDLRELASFLTISTQGLWAFSRSLNDVAPLRQYVSNLLAFVTKRITS